MDEFSNHSGGIDHPLAHDAGVNHTIHSSVHIQPQNRRTANFLSRRAIGDLTNYAEIDQSGKIEAEDES
jgi:hypothetical protein